MNKNKIIALIVFLIFIVSSGMIIKSIFLNKDIDTITIDEAMNGNDKINELNDDRILIIYFSRSGNTETLANFIHEQTGGELLKLETKVPYPSDYDEVLAQAQEEQRKNARPELKTTINIDDYDVIFIGYPLWCYDIPMAFYTFFDSYDFEDKIIVPFMTHGTSGESGTFKKIGNYLDKATVLKGFNVYGTDVGKSKTQVDIWLKELGF